MRKLDQNGGVGATIAVVVLSLLLVGALIFGYVAFSEQQKYKTRTDEIVAKQVKIAVDQNSTTKDNEFAELSKSPVKNYNGPSTYGSITLKYPKTYSAYVDTSAQSNQPINGYFNPNFVPGIQSGSTFALRMQVTSEGYNEELQNFDSLAKDNKVSIKPFKFPNVKSVMGVKITGQLTPQVSGTMIMVPLRDKTIKLWTETDQYQKDFNKYVIPNFKFSP